MASKFTLNLYVILNSLLWHFTVANSLGTITIDFTVRITNLSNCASLVQVCRIKSHITSTSCIDTRRIRDSLEAFSIESTGTEDLIQKTFGVVTVGRISSHTPTRACSIAHGIVHCSFTLRCFGTVVSNG